MMTVPTVNNALIQHSSRIISCKRISQDAFLHEYESPEIAQSAKPGQFVQIRVTTDFLPLLPRPFSVLDVNKNHGTISVLFKVIGKATALLAEKEAGEYIGLLGPLGNTFITDPYKDLYLVAGGIGIPPLYFLIKTVHFSHFNVRLFFGASTKEDLFLADELQKMNIRIEFTTDDGSYGTKNLITAPLEKTLKESNTVKNACLMACGPMPMLAKVQRIALAYNIPAQLSVETIMACGIGLCQGCALPKRGNTGKCSGYHLVCVEGPIFSENDLILENG